MVIKLSGKSNLCELSTSKPKEDMLTSNFIGSFFF